MNLPKAKIRVVVFLTAILSFFVFASPISSQLSCDQEDLRSGDENKLKECIDFFDKKQKEAAQRGTTLQNEIAYQDNQIRLTSLRILEIEKQIEELTGQINRLEGVLGGLSQVFAERAAETYKIKRLGSPLTLFLTADSVSEFISRFHYLRRIQENDRALLIQMQSTQTSYEGQREKIQELQTRLESQKVQLANQKAQKQNLLEITKNDERRFQQLLAQAQAELEAIQAVIAGKGEEVEVGGVSEGKRIASIIPGASCNSSGSHLHFIVTQNGTTPNPFSYLSGIDHENCSGSSCGSGDGDPFNPGGGWPWPINPKVKFTQGYGSTWAVRNTWVGRIYNFHNGIDISNESSSEVKAVRGGTLYKGSYSGSGGCALRYVRVDHDDSDLDTLYFHINY